ncbi:DNA-processing protein DprA [Zobellella maritima]|uniref:DNA-processing protein DprA n=1 Tax=Zobellella maritima TaxID=2059725 RepID=UPI000E30858D|nr:DNA-processing protein DprA [Zobellella maritima]
MPGPDLERHPLLPWLALHDTPGIGPVTAGKLLQSLGTSWYRYPAALRRTGLSDEQVTLLFTPRQALLERVLAWRDAAGKRYILTRSDDAYPPLLRNLPDAPLLLFVEGELSALSCHQVAVVGSRKPSYVGRENTRKLVPQLVQAGAAITSGLALGVDGLGHRAALDACGTTLAVLGSGLEHCYPKRHQSLATDICAGGGALVSEFAPWVGPLAHHFPRRNRIISGLSLGVLVIEATERSGSLITARFALEQGREVFAIPGAWQNPQAVGCNRLIQQGAKLVCCVADIVEELAEFSLAAIKIHAPATVESLPYPDLLDNVGIEATAVDLIASRCQQPVQEVVTRLVELELAGWVEAVPGGYVRARRS